MTEKLYDTNSHIKNFTAKVIDCFEYGDKYAVILDKTAFFAEGGGQASDTGLIGSTKVEDVQLIDGKILHICSASLEKGKEYECEIDWDKRFRRMQNHSGEHILSGLIHKHFGLDNVGFHLGEQEVTMDINGILNRQQLHKIEILANEAIIKNAKFSIYYPKSEELDSLEYRSKLDLTENVRIVNIEGYDSCACCAPHVMAAGEIGIIKILDFFRLRDGIRLFIKCGFDALEDYHDRYLRSLKISDLLSSKQNEIGTATEQLLSIVSKQKQTISYLKKRLIEQMAQGYNTDKNLTLLFEDDLDIKELQLFADALYKKLGGIRGVFSDCDDGLRFAICSDEKSLSGFFCEFKKRFEVKGGGRGTMVQGTAKARRHQIEELCNELD